MLPASGTSSPAASRISVVLPAPSGPISPVTTPGRMREAHAVQRLRSGGRRR